jgi:hypothetical protein
VARDPIGDALDACLPQELGLVRGHLAAHSLGGGTAAAGRRALVQPAAGEASVVVDLPSGRSIGHAAWPKSGPPTFLLGDGSPITP